MNIIEKINELEINIKSFIADKNLPFLMLNNPNHNSPRSLNDENQCFFTVVQRSHIYLITHDDVQIMENFFNLNPETLNKINKIRSFTRDIYDDHNEFKHKRLKVTIEPDNSVEFLLVGLDLGSLRIKLTSTELTLTWCYRDHISVMYSADDDIIQKLNEALDLIIPQILTTFGFSNCTEDSEEVITFMNKSIDELVVDHFAKFGFKYIHKNELIKNACLVSNISFDDIENYDEKSNSVSIPHMMCLLPSIMRSVSSDVSAYSKFKQLLSLVSFYDDLHSIKTESLLIFKEYSKVELSPSANLQSNLFSIMMGSLFKLDVGFELKPYPDSDNHLCDSLSENGYSYMLEIYINDVKEPDNFYKYFCNDLDYIYTIMLSKIRNIIQASLLNSDDPLTERQLEVYKMIIV